MEQIVRIGKISTIDYTNGMASVVYTDRNHEPSPSFPFFSFAYDLPKIDDTVVVLLLPNSTTRGFILGVPWSAAKIPPEIGAGVFYKEFADGAYVKYDAESKMMDVAANEVKFMNLNAENVEVKGDLTAKTINAKCLSVDSITVTEKAAFQELHVLGRATIRDLDVTGIATGSFPIHGGVDE